MKNRFNEQLAEINYSLIEMGGTVESAISKATKALIEQDIELAQIVIGNDYEVDAQEKDIERKCLQILQTQHPVKKELHQVSSVLKMITDMERIGDHAADISEICIKIANQEYIKELEHIPQMAHASMQMLTNSIDAYVKQDLDLAKSVIIDDDFIDDLFVTIRKDLISLVQNDPTNCEQAFDLFQIAKYYERIGDHAVNLAGWVIFSITGIHRDRQVF